MAAVQYYATGRRKTSTARVFLRPGTGAVTINRRAFETFFPTEALRTQIRQPLMLTEFGGIAFSRDRQSTWGYSRCSSAEDFARRYRELLDVVRERNHPEIDGKRDHTLPEANPDRRLGHRRSHGHVHDSTSLNDAAGSMSQRTEQFVCLAALVSVADPDADHVAGSVSSPANEAG